MPLDAAPEVNTQPSLAHLSHVLRHQELWPLGFEWDYDDCRRCAMALAHDLYEAVRTPCLIEMGRVFELPHRVAWTIFIQCYELLRLPAPEDVTPEHVASAIDSYLATKE